MRAALLIAAFLALAACETPQPEDTAPMRSDTKQQPSTLTPGVSISGHANIGITRRF